MACKLGGPLPHSTSRAQGPFNVSDQTKWGVAHQRVEQAGSGGDNTACRVGGPLPNSTYAATSAEPSMTVTAPFGAYASFTEAWTADAVRQNTRELPLKSLLEQARRLRTGLQNVSMVGADAVEGCAAGAALLEALEDEIAVRELKQRTSPALEAGGVGDAVERAVTSLLARLRTVNTIDYLETRARLEAQVEALEASKTAHAAAANAAASKRIHTKSVWESIRETARATLGVAIADIDGAVDARTLNHPLINRGL